VQYEKRKLACRTRYIAAEPLVPDPCPFEVEIYIVQLKKYKLAGKSKSKAIPVTGHGGL
jgi:hypothetical protein